ncbi:unnamed protein product [Lampetra planeri]
MPTEERDLGAVPALSVPCPPSSFRLVPARPSARTHRPPCASGEERHRDVRNNGDDVAPRLRRPSYPSPALGRGSLVAIGAAHTPQPRVETCERRGLKSANKI